MDVGRKKTKEMKRIIVNIVLVLVALSGLTVTTIFNGIVALLGLIPLYLGALGLIKLNTRWIEEY